MSDVNRVDYDGEGLSEEAVAPTPWRVDAGLEQYRGQHHIAGSWPTRERVVVGVSGGPESLALMRRAARIASRTAGGEWVAVYVSRRDGLTGVHVLPRDSSGDLAEGHDIAFDEPLFDVYAVGGPN